MLRHLEPLIIAFTFWLVSAATLYRNPAARQGRLFFLCSQVGAGTLAIGKIASFNETWALSPFHSLLCMLAAFLLHFHLVFPRPVLPSHRRLILGSTYGLALILIMPNLLFSAAGLDASSWSYAWHGVERAFLAVAMLGSIGRLLYTYHVSGQPRSRRQIRLVALGTIVAFLPVAFLSLLPEMFSGSFLIPYEVSFLALPLIPLSYAVAIHRPRLLELDRLLNRSLVHLILGGLWVGLYLLLTVGIQALFTSSLLTYPTLGALVAASVAATFVPARRIVQRWVDRLFYGSWYDYRSLVTDISRGLSQVHDESALVQQLVGRLTEAMSLRGAALLLSTESSVLALRGCRGFDCAEEHEHLSLDSAMIRLLRQRARPVDLAHLRQGLVDQELKSAERAWLETAHAQLFVPIALKGELWGLLIVGSKKADEFFDDEDLRILETLSHQAALAAENVRLLDAARRRQDELEAMHRQLLISREDERKRIARDLHDRLLQELLALNMEVEVAIDVAGDGPISERLGTVLQHVLTMIAQTRDICFELRPPDLSITGLADAIRAHTEERARQWGNTRVVGGFSRVLRGDAPPGLTITLDLEPDRGLLADEVATALFRVYQEALANVHKHAQAEQVWVRERLMGAWVELCVGDDGRGFARPEHRGDLVRQKHFGLLGMQEWMAAVGGEMHVTSWPGSGTEVSVRAPLRPRQGI
jgi:signal transduction histidine kinase